jgi:hypothetical protein
VLCPVLRPPALESLLSSPPPSTIIFPSAAALDHYPYCLGAVGMSRGPPGQQACEMNVCDDDGHGYHGQDMEGRAHAGRGGRGRGEARGKRKSFDINVASEKMKRCRIAVSPGELRLRKDLEQCHDLEDARLADSLRFIRTPDPLTVNILFESPAPSLGMGGAAPLRAGPSGAMMGLGRPNAFSIKVPRFYPHSPPLVTVPDPKFHGRLPFVGEDGRVTHPLVNQDWNVIMTLRDVVGALRLIRAWDGKEPARLDSDASMHVC